MDKILLYVLFFIGFYLVMKSSEWLVDGASSLAKKLKVSDMVIGLTIVAFGTSTPELIVNIFASSQGKTDIAIGNILGSNIFNILVILGISCLFMPIKVQHQTYKKEIPYSLLAAVTVGFMANDFLFDGVSIKKSLPDIKYDNALTRVDGFILLLFFTIFMYYIFEVAKKEQETFVDDGKTKIFSTSKSLILILLGLTGLVFGGKWIVDGAVEIARGFGVSESLIGLTIVAAGTSIPELATSITAARKGNSDIAMGNVVGSNIFNIFFILGISSLINPLPLNPKSNIDILMTIAVTLFLFFFSKDRKVSKYEGISFLVIYILYTSFLIYQG